MKLVALVHTEGVLLSNKYYVLELAYRDIEGTSRTFFIKSPISYRRAIRENPHLHKSLETIVCTKNYYKNNRVHSFLYVIRFLQDKFRRLDGTFGYKGKSFQSDVLRKANIPAVNVEMLGVPSISMLSTYHPQRAPCSFHPGDGYKCATHVANLVYDFLAMMPFSSAFSLSNSRFLPKR